MFFIVLVSLFSVCSFLSMWGLEALLMYRVLGGTGLRVSVFSFGVYSVTGMYGVVRREDAIGVLRFAFEHGVNFFDTADMYGNGLGEEILCEALRGEDYIVATKIGYDFYSGVSPPPRRYDEEYLVKAAARSARRLCKTPEVIQIHNPPLEVLRRPSLYRVMRRLVREGYTSHTGIALGPETDILLEAREALEHEEVETIQVVYNILEQEPGATIAREARARGVGVITRVPHAGGVLDESITPGDVERLSDHRSLRRRGWYEWAFRVYSEMKPVLAKVPGSPGERALALILSSIPVDSIVLIARSREKLAEYLAEESLYPVPPAIVDSIRRIYLKNIRDSPEKPEKSLRILETPA